jgi:hypothetical protein
MNDFLDFLSIILKIILIGIATILIAGGYTFLVFFLINYVNIPMLNMGIFLGLTSIIMILLYLLIGVFFAFKYGDVIWNKILDLW